MKRRILAFLLSVCMLISLCPLSLNALAVDEPGIYEELGETALCTIGEGSHFIHALTDGSAEPYFADDMEPVNGSKTHVLAKDDSTVIVLPDSFCYFEQTYDIYIEVINNMEPNLEYWQWKCTVDQDGFLSLQVVNYDVPVDFSLRVWLQQDGEIIRDLNFSAGACYLSYKETVRLWSDNGNLYTNFEQPAVWKNPGWSTTGSDYVVCEDDKSDRYLFGHGNYEGVVDLRYATSKGVSEWLIGYFGYDVEFQSQYIIIEPNIIQVAEDMPLVVPSIITDGTYFFESATVSDMMWLADETMITPETMLTLSQLQQVIVDRPVCVYINAYHQHSWIYENDGENTLVASCAAGENCDYWGDDYRVTISAYDKGYDGRPAEVELSATTIAGQDDELEIEYYDDITGEKLDGPPSEIGYYTAKVTVDGVSASVGYEIFYYTPDGRVTIEDWTYGETPNQPGLLCNNLPDPIAVYTYATKSGESLDDVPTDVGKYTVTAYVSSYTGESYETSTDFEIRKFEGNKITEFECGDISDGEDPTASAQAIFGEPGIVYSKDDEVWGDWESIYEGPGIYYAQAIVEETNNYNGCNAFTSFHVIAEGEGELTIEDWTYGEPANAPTLASDTNDGADVTITYLDSGRNILADVPTDAGEYYVLAEVAATECYTAYSAEAAFCIHPYEGNEITTFICDAPAAGEYPIPYAEAIFGDPFFCYSKDGVCWGEWDDAYDGPGSYQVMAVVDETDNYNGCERTLTLKVTGEGSGELFMDGWTYGEEANAPRLENNTNQGAEVDYQYRNAEGDLIADVPTDAGLYTVTANVAATEYCTAYSVSTSFEVGKFLDNAIMYFECSDLPTLCDPESEATAIYGEVQYLYSKDRKSWSDWNDIYEGPGSYYAKAYVEDTDNYNGCEAIRTLSVMGEGGGHLWIESWVYGEEAREPQLTDNTNEGAEVIYTYLDEFGSPLAGVPTDAGEYILQANVAQTKYYCEYELRTSFSIGKYYGNGIELYCEDLTEGYSPDPDAEAYFGEVSFCYSKDGESWGDWSDIYDAPGLYTVKAYVEDTPNYEGCEATQTFKVTGEGSGELAVEGWVYGAAAKEPVLSGNTNAGAEISYVYKTADGELLDGIPTEVGGYIVEAYVAETEYYSDYCASAEFEIARFEANEIIVLTCDALTEGEAPAPCGEAIYGEVSFCYSKDGESWGDWSDIYEGPGSYSVKGYVEDTPNYNGCESVIGVIVVGTGSGLLTMEGWTYGEAAAEPALTENTNEGAETVYTYYDAENNLLDGAPTEAGCYYVKAFVEATEFYTDYTVTAPFEIAKYEFNVITDLTCADIAGEGAPNPEAAAIFGEAAFLYSKDGESWGSWEEIFDGSGEYTVKAYVEETANYNGCEKTLAFLVKGSARCICDRIVPFNVCCPKQYKLFLNQFDAGIYNFRRAIGGYTIQDPETGLYVGFCGGIVMSKVPCVWAMDGASFYVTVCQPSCCMLCPCAVRFYLNCDPEGNLTVGLHPMVTHFACHYESEQHCYQVKNNCCGTHTYVCCICGDTYTEACTYDECDHCTVCGGFDMSKAGVKCVNVKVEAVRICGCCCMPRTVYRASVSAFAEGTCVAKVEYSTNGVTYANGCTFTAYCPIETLWVRVTDKRGNVTYWQYANGETTRV